MAGKRQHYIPQFLQRGFTIEKNGAKTWVARVDRNPYQSNIQNVGVEGYFYTKENNIIVDELITKEEEIISKTVNSLKKYDNNTPVSGEVAAKLVAHFEIRTRSLRVNFSQAIKNIVQAISDTFENKTLFYDYLVRKIKRDRKFIKDIIDKVQISNKQKKILTRTIQKDPNLLLYYLPDSVMSIMATQLRQEFSSQIINNKIKEIHLKTLKETIEPEEKINIFSRLNFRIIKTKEILILGDSIVVFINSLGIQKPFYDKDDKIRLLVMPLDSNTYLIGSSDRSHEYSIEEIRNFISSCSLEFFISSDKDIAEKYCKQIGSFASILSRCQADSIIREVLNE
ncbi:DUF4238 domain-containing protein [Eikenella corrodens]|uniref:DUF4238 domain-containing protein n=1 Tax=Eikenella corrodens TaxID=539 RepID=UPI00129B4228|nr:DUF4238 domain-containing protein [Eikenella corrodens]